MSTITELYMQSLLAEAAYSDLSGSIDTKSDLSGRLNVANENRFHGKFSKTQADEFAEHWKVVSQYTAPDGILVENSGQNTVFANIVHHKRRSSLIT